MPFDIETQIEAWRTQLLDTTKRNRLINFKTGRGGGIPLVYPDPGDLWHLLVGDSRPLTFPWKRDLIELPDEAAEANDPQDDEISTDADESPAPGGSLRVLDQCRHSPWLQPDHLLTELPDKRLETRLTRLAYNARESLTEQGVTILYVVFGFLRWFESPDSKEGIRSPLLLVPVRLERDSVQSPWRLRAEDQEVLFNQTLAQRLAGDFKLTVPTVDEEQIDADDPAWLKSYLAAVQHCVRHQPRWEVLDETALGAFNFQKLAMWEDLGRNRERIKGHELCRAIAGDRSAAPRCPADLPAPGELDDKTRPEETHHILDADSSQHAAVVAATRGASLVLDGPPGTGKSQTIANTIAEFLAAGKTVLFVSEKAAALEVVKRRLDERQLGDFCLALHSHKANKREVVSELGRCLRLAPETYRDPSEELARLRETRGQLNFYVRELHIIRRPLGRSAYQVHGELSRLDHLASASRCPIPQVLQRDAAYLRQLTDLLARLPDCRSVIEEGERHPWRGCRAEVYSLTLREDVRHHLSRLADCVQQLIGASELLHELELGPAASTFGLCRSALERARRLLECPQIPADWFGGDPRPVAEAMVRMDQLTQSARHVQRTLPEFAPDALRHLEPSLLAALAPALRGDHLRLPPRDGETVRARRQRLAHVAGVLVELRQHAQAAEEAEQRVISLLGIPLPRQPVTALRRFAEMIEHVAGMQPVRRSHWETVRRRELQSIFARCREEAHTARELRIELMARLSPQAFAPESASLAAQASRYRSFWACLLPSWWSFKRQVAGWYTQTPAGKAALLGDLDKLAAYHRRMDYCRQVQAQYAADLLLDTDGQPDWDATLDALGAVDRLEQFGKIPPALRAVLSEGASIEREALAGSARDLKCQAAVLRQRCEAAGREYDLDKSGDGPSQHTRSTAGELTAWLGVQAEAVEHEAGTLARLCMFLVEAHDLPVALVPERLRALAELTRLQEQVSRLGKQLGLAEDSHAVEGWDWSDLAQHAGKLLALLQSWSWSGPLPREIVRALTQTDARARAAEAVRLGDVARATGLDESWQFLTQLFDTDQDISTGITLGRAPLGDLHAWLTTRAGDAHRIQEWTCFRDVQREVAKAGVLPILEEVLRREVRLMEAADAFRTRFLRLWLDAIHAEVPALRQFSTENQDRVIERFRALDRGSVASAPGRIRNLMLSRPDRPAAAAGDAPGSSELATLLREVNKKRRHLPLRKLFAAIPSLLPRLKPCLMMSPLAVSTYLQSPDLQFDLVIFDEASQVRPYDAVCAIYRGRQLVVAGDQKQLPPTSFFERALEGDSPAADETEDEETALSDFESVLDVCCTLGLPRRRLRWHYRSRREGLIAFANHHVYANELVTFPSVHDLQGNPAVAFEYVAAGRWKTGASGGFNVVEARRTAELVLEHFREHPEESLGVIAFSQRQQLRILDELEHLRLANPDLEEFFGEGRDEPFFVKNLENVQGDERDVIFLSVGYGPDEVGGVIRHNFGPLNRHGGERRLNVAVTRARQRMIVVSSLRAENIDLSRTKAFGARMLRAYLDYAEHGPETLRAAITEDGDREFDSPFEREVQEELTRQRLTVHRQVGCGGFRIDLAVVDPSAPGRYLLGVECDGATYHSSATARDRDRLRQEVLESLGWHICRIWSTDWVRDRGAQVRRVLAALEKARRQPPPSPPPSPTSPVPLPQEKHGPESGGRSVVPTHPAPANYDSIDAVPSSTIKEELIRFLQAYGATESDDLIQALARRLGFKRVGKRIQARIEEEIEWLVRAGDVRRAADQRLQVPPGQRLATC